MAKNVWDKIAEEDAATVLKAAELRGKAKEYSTENNKESPENAKEAKNIIDSADMIAKAKSAPKSEVVPEKTISDEESASIKESILQMMERAKERARGQ